MDVVETWVNKTETYTPYVKTKNSTPRARF